ncbi:MAG TPA: hypothetical protein VLZ75_03085 [Chitinophagales bacterium]|nr:hypothetical protein [Chitinophagales bacterium]
MKKIISILLILISLSIFSVRISKNIEINQNLTGYLKRASNANTIDLAKQELAIAVNYLEEKNLTSGYTSVFYKTPDEDLGFWYKNLKESLIELENLKSESALEKSNVLLKLRESLLSSGKSNVIAPEGISVFPNNKLWTFLMWLGLAFLLSGLVLLVPMEEELAKENKS